MGPILVERERACHLHEVDAAAVGLQRCPSNAYDPVACFGHASDSRLARCESASPVEGVWCEPEVSIHHIDVDLRHFQHFDVDAACTGARLAPAGVRNAFAPSTAEMMLSAFQLTIALAYCSKAAGLSFSVPPRS